MLNALFRRKAPQPEIVSVTGRDLTPQENPDGRYGPGWCRLVIGYADGTTRESSLVATVPHATALRLTAQ
jgi:hypothetical protein